MLFTAELQQPVNRLQGFGPAVCETLAGLGINSIGRLIHHFPVRYDDRKNFNTLSDLSAEDGHLNAVITIISYEYIPWKGKKALKVKFSDGFQEGALLCFGRNFLEKKLIIGENYFLSGQFQKKYGEWQASGFEFEKVSSSPRLFGSILPVYPLAGSLTQKRLRNGIKAGLTSFAIDVREEIPESIRVRHNLIPLKTALNQIHFPDNFDQCRKAEHTLKFRELFHLQTAVMRKKTSLPIKQENGRPFPETLKDKVKYSLPFALTEGQNSVLKEIKEDYLAGNNFCRLLQGEVGSGKTLVAFLAALPYIEAGYQCAFMAPTELLARQHADNADKLLSPYKIRVAFLSGQTEAPGREQLKKELASGNIDLLIGTHALFSGDIEFSRLKFIIIDEQHRFGVEQRKLMTEKGENPDILMMSATPIPRTLALTVFGDLKISEIRKLPKGRKPIITHLARQGNELKVYEFVRKELESGRQAYFVYPLIEASDKLDLKNAEDMYLHLSREIFPDFECALLHSRIKEDEKREIMRNFQKGKISLLAATSVVEVGVDVPNATIMVIEHAERFGLSALHQLRGRIGRGAYQSYAFLVYSPSLTEEGKTRIMVMKNSSDGFYIAEEDLKLRGPGDLSGIRQSGFLRLQIADLKGDLDLLLQAREEAVALFERDPGLLDPENRDLSELFNRFPPFNDELMAGV